MKKLLLLILILISFKSNSQQTETYKNFIEQLKKNSKTDKNDKTVYNLLNDFYEQVLQSEKGDLKPETIQEIQKFYENKNGKNSQILNMFFAYQEHISQTAAVGKKTDPTFQVNVMTDLESEIKNTYGKIPVIIRIYKAEALESNGQTEEAIALISQSLVEYPDSVPLKVYKYLGTKDENIKNDLIKNHPNHWMVQQYEIK